MVPVGFAFGSTHPTFSLYKKTAFAHGVSEGRQETRAAIPAAQKVIRYQAMLLTRLPVRNSWSISPW
jgi:hypothetical protein